MIIRVPNYMLKHLDHSMFLEINGIMWHVTPTPAKYVINQSHIGVNTTYYPMVKFIRDKFRDKKTWIIVVRCVGLGDTVGRYTV